MSGLSIYEINIVTAPVKIDVKNNDVNSFANKQYKEMVADWQFFRDAFFGGMSLLNEKYIPRFKKEPPEKYKGRLRRSHYLNYMDISINSYKSTVYSTRPDRSKVNPKIVNKYFDDIDLQGSDVDTFYKEVYQWAQVYGFMGIQIDAPTLDVPEGKLPTQRDVIDQDIRHYACLVHPTDILNWRFKAGRPKSNKTLELVAIRLDDIVRIDKEGKAKLESGVKLITPYYIADYDKSGNLIKATEHNMGFMPFRFVGDQKFDFPVYLPTLKDLAYKSFNLLTLSLALDNVLYYNGDPFIKAATDRDLEDVYTASSQFIQLNPKEDMSFVVLPHEVVSNYITRMDDLKKEIRMMMLKMTSEQKKTNQIESVDSKKLDKKEYTEFLKTQSAFMEQAENTVLEILYHIENIKWDGKVVKYDRDYDLETMQTKLKGFLEGVDKIDTHSETHKREQAKEYVNIQLGQVLPPDIINKIHEEIDEADFADPLEAIGTLETMADEDSKIDNRYENVDDPEEAKQILRDQ